MKKSFKSSLHTLLKGLAKSIFGSVLSVFLLPVFLLIYLVFYIPCMFISMVVKVKYGPTTEKPSGTDILSGKESSTSRAIINIAFRINGEFEQTKFQNKIWNLVHNSLDKNGQGRYRRMMQVYTKVFGYKFWVDAEEFNIANHFSMVTMNDLVFHGIEQELSKPKDKIDLTRITEIKNFLDDPESIEWHSFMKVFLNKHGNQELKFGQPKWEILVVLESKTKYSALFRFHHSIADGVYFSQMLCEAFMNSPSEMIQSYVPPSRIERWMTFVWSLTLLPFGLWKLIQHNDKNVLHGPPLTGKKKYFLSKPVTLDYLRNIRRRTNASIHGILFSCLSHAFAEHFKDRLTNVPAVTTVIPIPLQNLKEPIELKNKYALASLKLPTPSPSDPYMSSLRRLKKIEKVLSEAKTDPSFLSAHSLLTSVCSVMPACVGESFISAKGCSANFSTLPGPIEKICYKEDLIEEIMFWTRDRDPLGVAVSILSYSGLLRVGLLIDSALLVDESEGDKFLRNFLKETDNILEDIKTETLEVNDEAKSIHVPKIANTFLRNFRKIVHSVCKNWQLV